MILSKFPRNDIMVLKLQGDVMGGPEAVQVNDEINQFLDGGILRVIIDLSEVERMNSSGLGILINALTTYRQNGGELKLAGPTPLVQNLLKITRLTNIFEYYESVEAAERSF